MIDQRQETLHQVIRAAGALAKDYYERRGALQIDTKSDLQDLATEADRNVERHIIEALSAHFPDDAFFGEESGASAGASRAGTWVIDPIDGTTNFVRGFPYWGVSIGYVENDELLLGAVYDPLHDELFHARRGAGAFMNDSRLTMAGDARAESSLVAVGVSNRMTFGGYLDAIQWLHTRGIEHRRFCCAALGLVHVAAGRSEAYVEGHLNAWDCMGGLLVVEEAGGWSNWSQLPADWRQGGPVLVADRGLAAELAPLLDMH